MAIPKQKRGESKQDYGTPADFRAALVKKFGPLEVDLAARGNGGWNWSGQNRLHKNVIGILK